MSELTIEQVQTMLARAEAAVLRLQEENGTLHEQVDLQIPRQAMEQMKIANDQLRESLRWAVHELAGKAVGAWHGYEERYACYYCQAVLGHTATCPYARARKLLEEKP